MSYEQQLLTERRIARWQLQEIRRMFDMADTENSGYLSPTDIGLMLQRVCKGSAIGYEDLQVVFQKIGSSTGDSISWEEFLRAMHKWLVEIKALPEFVENIDIIGHPYEKEILHRNLTNFFLQFKQTVVNISGIEFEYLRALKLEDRAEMWDYLNQGLTLSNEEKWKYYQENCELLNSFSTIAGAVNATSPTSILEGCRKLVRLLNILSVVTDPQERFEIASHLLRLFDLLINSNVIHRIVALLGASAEPHIQWEATKIITFFAPGPRIAHTPEDSLFHPKKMVTKALLINSGVVQKLLELTKSPCVEVKEQAVLALGFIARHDQEPRDVIVMLGGIEILLSSLTETRASSMVQKVTWTLSILCGATLPRGASLKPGKSVIDILAAVVKLLFAPENPEILANVLVILSYLLPLVDINAENMKVWEQLVQLLSFPNHSIKRSSLNAVKNVITASDTQTQFMVECGLISQLSELLISQNQDVRIDACSVLAFLGAKGYSWNIMDSNIFPILCRLIYDDSVLRWEIVKIIKSLSTGPIHNILYLIRNNVVKVIFNNLVSFKEYDPILAEVYGTMNATYNMMYFYDCLETLNNVLMNGISADSTGAVINAFDRECIGKLEVLIDIVATDIRQCVFDIKNLSDYNCNFVDILRLFISHIRDGHFAKVSENSQTLAALCNVLLHDLNDKVNSAIEVYKAKLKAAAAVTILEVRCFSAKNFPDGDNRVLEIRSDVSLMELVLQVENRYQMSPITLLYIDEANEQITIDSDLVLRKAIHTAYAQALNKTKVIVRLIVRLPLAVEKTDLDLEMFKGSQPIIPTESLSTRDFWTNLSQKESLLFGLHKSTGFSMAELEKIYMAFAKITRKRLVHKEKGYVTLPEFTEIMKVAIKNPDLINEMFNALDKSKIGKVDFSDFVCGISVLQHGTLEEKLKFAFLAYDVDHNGGIDKKELFMLLKSSAEAKNTRITNQELSKVVDDVFEKFDTDNDGQLSFPEFKRAVFSQALIINPFWMSTSFKLGGEKVARKVHFVNQVTCDKCRRAFIPSRLEDKWCEFCKKNAVTGSPYATGKYSKV